MKVVQGGLFEKGKETRRRGRRTIGKVKEE
jgi:hypothetical protein